MALIGKNWKDDSKGDESINALSHWKDDEKEKEDITLLSHWKDDESTPNYCDDIHIKHFKD